MQFPANFLWGASTSAYQIEGAAAEEGRGPSIWDDFCKRPGTIAKGEDGDRACDHYHRYAEDVALMQQMQLGAYRFSISWPRVFPEGRGRVNEQGLDFYQRLVDRLLATEVQPWITLFHWDYPSSLEKQGGWLNKDSPHWFAEYTKVVVERLGDRVKHWITFNEPQVFLQFGHLDGTHAPGKKLHIAEGLQAYHHVLLSHGLAVATIRASASSPWVGWAPACIGKVPLTNSTENIEAVRKSMFGIDPTNMWNNAWYNDPVFFGRYPEEGLAAYGESAPKYTPADMELICQPLDFLGLNIYFAEQVAVDAASGICEVPFSEHTPRTGMGWPMVPESMYWGPKMMYQRYQTPIVITENGMALEDAPDAEGKVHDQPRVGFIRRYLEQLHHAMADGVDVRGYFYWSLLDNFEWAEGYRPRFGLVYVDFESGTRTLKDSAVWYEALLGSQRDNVFKP